MQFDLFTQSGKTSPASCPTKPTGSAVSWEDLSALIPHSFQAKGSGGPVRVWLMDPSAPPLGESWMPNISEWPNDASVCSLWQVLETGRIPFKYFLTSLACSGILRRAEKRGKTLPALLARALKAVVDSARTLISGGGSYQLSPSLTASGRGVERTGESRGQDCVVPVHFIDCAPTLDQRAGRSGANAFATSGGLIPVELSNGDISHCLNAGGMGRIDYETETLVTHALRAEGHDASEDGTGRGTPIVPVAIPILEAGARTGRSTSDIRVGVGVGVGVDGDPMFTLQSGKQHAVATAYRTSSNCGVYETGDRIDALTTGTDPTSHVLAFSCKDSGADAGDVAPTLRAMEFDKSHANGGEQIAVAFDTTQITSKANRCNPMDGDPCHPLAAGAHSPAVAFRAAGQDGFTPSEVSPPVANSDGGGGGDKAHVLIGETWAVRRLTPIETSALQGFPPTYAHVPRRPRKIDADEAAHYLSHGIEAYLDGEQWMTRAAADGSIYRAHGNSMAVPVMSWLAKRIKDANER